MRNHKTRNRTRQAHEPRDWFRITNATDTSGAAEILIYDEIGYGGWFYEGVTANSLVRQLDAIESDEIRVRINSPGGDVFEGIAILNALRAHPARVTTIVDGLAASAASFIAMAGDEIVIARNAEIMIHDPSALCIGNASDMRDLADQLDRIGDNIASMYSDRAGGTVEHWREAMRTETWYSDEEALAAGLVDRIERFDTDEKEPVKNRFDLSVFNYAGRRAAPAPAIHNSGAAPVPASAEPVEDHPHKEDTVMVNLNEELRDRLGITDAEITDEALLEQLDEVLTRPDEPTPPAPQIPEGAVVVDAAQLAELRAAAQAGLEARNRQQEDDRNRFLDSAIAAGKFPPARREHYAAMLQADPEGARQVIDALAPGLVPVAELGHSQPADMSADDAAYAALFGKEA
ncbi:MAG: head maturation protease, ClpP-related [Rhodococcus sp. (in: high G+C Gram-positive bacteria)]